jgi:two-component system, OmpR family, response regulator
MESSPHIVVVDDHKDIRELVTRYLGEHGYRVSAAESGRAFLKLLEASAPDLVVLDIMMPGGDGISLCRELRANNRQVRRTPTGSSGSRWAPTTTSPSPLIPASC